MIKIQRIHANAVIPVRVHPTDAGADLYTPRDVGILPGEGMIVWLGIRSEIPEGLYIQIEDRSSVAKRGVKVFAGVIDSAYRGEWGVNLWNFSRDRQWFSQGDRIAQAILLRLGWNIPWDYNQSFPPLWPRYEKDFEEVSELSETERGGGGHGSTGR